MTTTTSKHRRETATRTEPRIQPLGRHIGEYDIEDRTLERLGAAAVTIEDFYNIVRVDDFPAGVGR